MGYDQLHNGECVDAGLHQETAPGVLVSLRRKPVWSDCDDWTILQVCVADGDASPERFDHIHNLLNEQVTRDTYLDFLRKRGFLPKQN